MMGSKERAFGSPCNLSLETLVPAEHFYRHLDAGLDLTFVRHLVADCYAPTGRPSIDPVVFFRLQLVMFFEGLRSERELVRVAADRLSVRWYLGYDLDEAPPDHSSLTKIRQRYGLAIFRRSFEAIVEECREAGLVWGKELYFDATQVDANASLDSISPRFAVEAHLQDLFESTCEPDEADPASEPPALPVTAPPAIRDELERENGARHDWLARAGRTGGSNTAATGAARISRPAGPTRTRR
jgi:transposase